MGLLLCNVGYYYCILSCQLFSGLDPRTLCLFSLAKVVLVPVGFCTYSLLRRQTWASTLHSYLFQEGNHTHSFLPSYAPCQPYPKQVNKGNPLRSFIITAFGMPPKTEYAWSIKRKWEESQGYRFTCTSGLSSTADTKKYSL